MYFATHWKCLVKYSAHFVAYVCLLLNNEMQARFWSVFKVGEQVSIIFLDSQIFDEVLDNFPRLSYRLTFIMLNMEIVDNLEFWQTICEFRGLKHVFHSRVSRNRIKGHKGKVDTNRLVSETRQIWKDLLLLDSPNVHPQYEKKKSKKAGKSQL